MRGRPTVTLLSPVSHTVDLPDVVTLTPSDTLCQAFFSPFKVSRLMCKGEKCMARYEVKT